jgi:hypothetical protein
VPLRTAGVDTARPPDHAPEPDLAPGSCPTPEPAPESEPVPEPDLAAEPEPAREPHRAPGPRAAGLFGAITVVPALLATAWLLLSLPLLLAGRLSALPLAFMFFPLAAGLCYVALRQRPVVWPGFRGERKPVPSWSVAATATVAVGFAVWQIAARSQQIIVLRDPGIYLQTGYWIAHHGSLPIPYSAEAFGGAHPGLTFASAGFYPTGSGLAPQFMSGLPLVLAAAIWLGGVPAALVITPLIGACAVLSFGGLAGRLIGARWAPAAAAALALSLPEQYTSRGTFSEPLAQVLLFGGLCLLIDALVLARQPDPVPARGTSAPDVPAAAHSTLAPDVPAAAHSTLAPDVPAAAHSTLAPDVPAPARGNSAPDVPAPADWPGQDRVLAALAGLVLGLTVLVRIDALSDILPAVPFLGLLLVAGRRQAVPFGLGLVVGVGYGLADGALLSRPYLDLVGSSLRPLGLIAAAVLAATAVGLAVARSRAVRARLRGWRPAEPVVFWVPVAAAAVTVTIFVGFAARPLVQKAAGPYNQNSLYWAVWYIGLPAVLLGVCGLGILAQRGTRALLAWADRAAEARTWALPLLIALWVSVTVLWRPAIAPDQPWASRRLVPFVLPGLILAAIWASAWLRNLAGVGPRGRARVTSAVVACCCVASLIIPATLTNLDLGSSGQALTARGMAFRPVGAGQLAAVTGLCAAIGPDASVVILDSVTAGQFAQVIRGLCDTPTAIMDRPTPATVGAVVSGIERAGRHPVLLAQDAAELAPYGGVPQQVVNLATTQDARTLTAPPTRTWPIRYTVWMSQPTTAVAGGPA